MLGVQLSSILKIYMLLLLLFLMLILFFDVDTFSVLALEASLGGVAGEGLGAESTFDRNNLGQVVAKVIKLS